MFKEYNEMKEEIKNSETSVEYTNKYGWCKQKNVWKNGVETIVDSDGVLWLKEKHIEKGLDHKNVQVTKVK